MDEIKMVPTGNSTMHQILDIKLKKLREDLKADFREILLDVLGKKPGKKNDNE